MEKCLRCGKTLLFKGVKLADGRLCYKCFEELGFDKGMREYSWTNSYEDIKDGYQAYIEKKYLSDEPATKETVAMSGLQFAHYGEERDVDATEEEQAIFDHLISILDENGCETDLIRLVRRSSNYISASIDETDVARFKYTKRAKWILFPSTGNDKVQLESTDLQDLTEMIMDSYNRAMLYSGHRDIE